MLELVSPGGVHFGTLPPAGLRAEAVVDGAGLMGADLADGGVLTGVETAVRQNYLHMNKKVNLEGLKHRNIPEACHLELDGFDGCFCVLDAGVGLVLSFLATFSFFLVLLTFFTVNSSSSLSDGSL